MRWNYRNKEIYRVPFTDTTNVFKIGCKWITLFSYSSIVSIATGIVKYCIFTVVFFRLIKLISFQYTNHSNFQSKPMQVNAKMGFISIHTASIAMVALQRKPVQLIVLRCTYCILFSRSWKLNGIYIAIRREIR